MDEVNAHHRQIVAEALANGMAQDVAVPITLGELVLFHVLLQDYGLELVDQDQFVPLLERHVARIQGAR